MVPINNVGGSLYISESITLIGKDFSSKEKSQWLFEQTNKKFFLEFILY